MTGPAVGRSGRRGRVDDFDEHVGLGTVVAADGGDRFPFHCTAIADGSRRIPAGTEVTFCVVAGRLGRLEAADIRPTSLPRPAPGA